LRAIGLEGERSLGQEVLRARGLEGERFRGLRRFNTGRLTSAKTT